MRHRLKNYYRIPFGEIQLGHKSKSVTIWMFKRCWHVWRGYSK